MTSKLGRPSGRPRSRSSILGHPGASLETGEPVFPPPPGPPSSTTAFRSGGLLTLTLRGKAMDGSEEQQERNRPQLFHRAWKTGERMPVFHERQQAGGAPLRRARSISLFTNATSIDGSPSLAAQSTRPRNRGRFSQSFKVPAPLCHGAREDARSVVRMVHLSSKLILICSAPTKMCTSSQVRIVDRDALTSPLGHRLPSPVTS